MSAFSVSGIKSAAPWKSVYDPILPPSMWISPMQGRAGTDVKEISAVPEASTGTVFERVVVGWEALPTFTRINLQVTVGDPVAATSDRILGRIPSD